MGKETVLLLECDNSTCQRTVETGIPTRRNIPGIEVHPNQKFITAYNNGGFGEIQWQCVICGKVMEAVAMYDGSDPRAEILTQTNYRNPNCAADAVTRSVIDLNTRIKEIRTNKVKVEPKALKKENALKEGAMKLARTVSSISIKVPSLTR
jgi:hypothetical protein